MKRTFFLILISLGLAGALGCGQASSDAVASSTDHESLLGLLPVDATGVFYVDLKRVWDIDAVRENMAASDYVAEVVEETGIDLSRDIHSMMGVATADRGRGALVLDAEIDRDALIARIKENENAELSEETYEGVTILERSSGHGEDDGAIAFISESRIAIGTPDDVRAVIDVHQKRADSVLKNADLMKTIESADHSDMLWAAFSFSQDEARSLTENNPMLGQLGGLRSMVMGVDYRDRSIMLEIDCAGGDAQKNQQIYDMLNGIKSFAAMGTADKPQMAELLRSIEIISTEENVKISAMIPEALLQEMQAEQN